MNIPIELRKIDHTYFFFLPVSNPGCIPAGADLFPSSSSSLISCQRVGVEIVTKGIETKGYSQVGPGGSSYQTKLKINNS